LRLEPADIVLVAVDDVAADADDVGVVARDDIGEDVAGGKRPRKLL